MVDDRLVYQQFQESMRGPHSLLLERYLQARPLKGLEAGRSAVTSVMQRNKSAPFREERFIHLL